MPRTGQKTAERRAVLCLTLKTQDNDTHDRHARVSGQADQADERVRKAVLALEKFGKEYRKVSVK